ncbi:hypothetical protein GCM10010464_53640 [Pseudonocardia yunnanensis]
MSFSVSSAPIVTLATGADVPGPAVGAENSVTLCDLQILVYETTEAVSSQRPNGRSGGRGSVAGGRERGAPGHRWDGR